MASPRELAGTSLATAGAGLMALSYFAPEGALPDSSIGMDAGFALIMAGGALYFTGLAILKIKPKK